MRADRLAYKPDYWTHDQIGLLLAVRKKNRARDRTSNDPDRHCYTVFRKKNDPLYISF